MSVRSTYLDTREAAGSNPCQDQSDSDIAAGLRGKTLAITGASGYIASRLIAALDPVVCHLLRVSRSALPAIEPACPTVEDLIGDHRAPDLWQAVAAKADVIFHLASQTNVYDAADDPLADSWANVEPMIRLLEACRHSGRTVTVLFAGTGTQAGLPESLPVTEDHPDVPVTVYDLHKNMAEGYLKYYCRENWVTGASLRLGSVYGPGASSANSGRGVLNHIVRQAIEEGELQVYGKGDYQRDYVYVDDVARAFLCAAVRPERLEGRHFVVSTGEAHELVEVFALVAERVRAATERKVSLRHVEPPENLSPIEFRHFVADSSAFRAAVGWSPRCGLRDGIDRAIAACIASSVDASNCSGRVRSNSYAVR